MKVKTAKNSTRANSYTHWNKFERMFCESQRVRARKNWHNNTTTTTTRERMEASQHSRFNVYFMVSYCQDPAACYTHTIYMHIATEYPYYTQYSSLIRVFYCWARENVFYGQFQCVCMCLCIGDGECIIKSQNENNNINEKKTRLTACAHPHPLVSFMW